MQTLKRSVFIINKQRQIFRTVAFNHETEATDNTASKPFKEIPGPSSLPVIGPLLHSLPGGDLSKPDINLVGRLNARYGPIVKLDGAFGAPTFVFLFDPEAVEHVLRSENILPIRPGFQSLVHFREKNKPKPYSPTGLATDQGETWKKFRSVVNPIMLQPKTIRLYDTILNEVADDMVARMKSKRNEKNMLDAKFDVEMNLWALESIGVVALGGRLNCLDPNLPEDSPAKRMIEVVHDIFDMVTKLDLRPNLSRLFSTPTYKKAMRLYAEQLSLKKYFMSKAVEELKQEKKTNDEKGVLEKLLEIDENIAMIMASDMLFAGIDTVTSSYINLKKYFMSKAVEELKQEKKTNDEKGVLEKLLEIDENIAMIMASDMLFAGIDTSSNTVTATLYLLATNQKKQDKLREQLLSADEKRPYLKACLKESLRILPVASANLREATKDYNLLGYKVPKGTHVICCHHVLSTQDNEFPRPNEYIPERWLVDKMDPLYYGNAHPFAYMPFGFGARSCIGRRIAELEIQTFLAKVIQNFRVEWFGEPLRVQPKALNYMTGPYNFIFKDV